MPAFISRKEIAELRGELDEEKLKRMALQVTLIPIATHAGLSTLISLIRQPTVDEEQNTDLWTQLTQPELPYE